MICTRNNTKLIEVLKGQFPLSTDSDPFEFFPMSNELGFKKVIKILKSIRVSETEEKKAALLFGESNFISMLPVLSEFVSVIILADIDSSMHKHSRFMLDCFIKANSPDEFYKLYINNNPIDERKNFQLNSSQMVEFLKDPLGAQNAFLERNFFLNNQAAFEKCKAELAKIEIVQIQVDLGDVSLCQQLAATLKEHHTRLALCNFTNIHDYLKEKVIEPVKALLANSQQCLVMFSNGPLTDLRTSIYIGVTRYFQEISWKANNGKTHDYSLSVNQEVSQMRFFYKPRQAKDFGGECCYLAFKHDVVGEDCVELIQEIIDGRNNINDFSTKLHAHDTEEEASKFVKNKPHWIFKIRGNKDKINSHLRYLLDSKPVHYPLDMDTGSMTVNSKIICAYTPDKSITLTRSPLDVSLELTGDMKLNFTSRSLK